MYHENIYADSSLKTGPSQNFSNNVDDKRRGIFDTWREVPKTTVVMQACVHVYATDLQRACSAYMQAVGRRQGDRMKLYITRPGWLWIGMSPGKAGFLINWGVIGATSNLYYPSTNGVMVACYPPRRDWVTDQNVEVCWLTPVLLRNMLENSYWYEKNPKILYQQLAQTLLFQMRYDSLPNSKKQPSDRQRGWCTPCFHITLVLLSPLLFLPE